MPGLWQIRAASAQEGRWGLPKAYVGALSAARPLGEAGDPSSHHPTAVSITAIRATAGPPAPHAIAIAIATPAVAPASVHRVGSRNPCSTKQQVQNTLREADRVFNCVLGRGDNQEGAPAQTENFPPLKSWGESKTCPRLLLSSDTARRRQLACQCWSP